MVSGREGEAPTSPQHRIRPPHIMSANDLRGELASSHTLIYHSLSDTTKTSTSLLFLFCLFFVALVNSLDSCMGGPWFRGPIHLPPQLMLSLDMCCALNLALFPAACQLSCGCLCLFAISRFPRLQKERKKRALCRESNPRPCVKRDDVTSSWKLNQWRAARASSAERYRKIASKVIVWGRAPLCVCECV